MSLLSTQEVAYKFGVSRATVINWDKGGRLPSSTRVKESFRFYKEDYIIAVLNELVPKAPLYWCVYEEFFYRFHSKAERSNPWVDIEIDYWESKKRES